MTIILICLTASASCFGQGKKRQKEKDVVTDTVDVFKQFDNLNFTEKNVFWKDTNEIGLIQTQRYNTKTFDAGYSTQLTVVFYNWDSIELGVDYDINSLKAECELKRVFGGRKYNVFLGQIRLIKKTQDRLTFYFDIQALSNDRKVLLVYKGERTFRPDY